jgi:hypothetical protein
MNGLLVGKRAWIWAVIERSTMKAVGDDIRLRGKLGTGKYNLAWRLGCWLAGPSLED